MPKKIIIHGNPQSGSKIVRYLKERCKEIYVFLIENKDVETVKLSNVLPKLVEIPCYKLHQTKKKSKHNKNKKWHSPYKFHKTANK